MFRVRSSASRRPVRAPLACVSRASLLTFWQESDGSHDVLANVLSLHTRRIAACGGVRHSQTVAKRRSRQASGGAIGGYRQGDAVRRRGAHSETVRCDAAATAAIASPGPHVSPESPAPAPSDGARSAHHVSILPASVFRLDPSASARFLCDWRDGVCDGGRPSGSWCRPTAAAPRRSHAQSLCIGPSQRWSQRQTLGHTAGSRLRHTSAHRSAAAAAPRCAVSLSPI